MASPTGEVRHHGHRRAARLLSWIGSTTGEITVRRRGRFSDCRAELMCEIEILMVRTGLRDAIRHALLADLVRRAERQIILDGNIDRREKDRLDFRLALGRDLRRLQRRYRGSPCAPVIVALLTRIPA